MSSNICPGLRCSTKTLHSVWSFVWPLASLCLHAHPTGWHVSNLPRCICFDEPGETASFSPLSHATRTSFSHSQAWVYPKGSKQVFLWSLTHKVKSVRSEVPLPDVSTVVKRMEDTRLAAQLQLCWGLTHLLLHFAFAVIAELIWTIWLLPSSNSRAFSAYFLVIASALFRCLWENICPEDSPFYNLFKICHHLLTFKIFSLIPSLVTGPSVTSHFIARHLSRDIDSFASYQTVFSIVFWYSGLFSL